MRLKTRNQTRFRRFYKGADTTSGTLQSTDRPRFALKLGPFFGLLKQNLVGIGGLRPHNRIVPVSYPVRHFSLNFGPGSAELGPFFGCGITLVRASSGPMRAARLLIGAGSDADRQAKLLICLAVEGSLLGSDAILMTLYHAEN